MVRGFLELHLYGFLVAMGVMVGALVAEKVRQEHVARGTWQVANLQGRSVWDVLPWVVIPGVVGARLYHVIDWWSYYGQNLREIPQVWQGGLGIYGAIGGGVVGLVIWTHRTYKSDRTNRFWEWLDLVGIGLPLGQAIGRWGNYFNQELYGKPTNLPWAIYIDPAHRVSGVEQYTHFHPLFLYESMWNIVVFYVIICCWRRKKWKVGSGLFFTLYIMFYSIGRFFLEQLRIEPWSVQILFFGRVAMAQLVSAMLILVALANLGRLIKQHKLEKI